MSEVIEHAVDLIEHTLLVLVLDAKLIAVGLADGTGFVRPGVPDVGGEVVDVVGLFLPDPEELVHRAFEIRAAQGEDGKLLLQIVAVDKAKFFDRVGGGAVLRTSAPRAGRCSQAARKAVASCVRSPALTPL